MTKEEKAQAYADSIQFSVQDAVREAYLKGYEEGVRSVNPDRSETIDGVEYVDLRLPSGTLWAFANEVVVFGDAIELNIPTETQWEELKSFCKFEFSDNYVYVTGLNGKSFYISNRLVANTTDEKVLFWVEQNRAVTKYKYAACPKTLSKSGCFSGECLPLVLVKNKE